MWLHVHLQNNPFIYIIRPSPRSIAVSASGAEVNGPKLLGGRRYQFEITEVRSMAISWSKTLSD